MIADPTTWRWRAAIADDELRRRYTSAAFDDRSWADIELPGHWQRQPMFEQHGGPVLHRSEFDAEPPASSERAWLQLDGVLYQSDVWLDGSYLGDTEGYFFPHQFEITEALRQKPRHVLGIEVSCTPSDDPRRQRNLTGALQSSNVIPRSANPGGIWAPIRVICTGNVRIMHSRMVCVTADEQTATVACRVVLDSALECDVTLRTRVAGEEHLLAQHLAAGENRFEWSITVPRPSLWWPHNLGEPVMHAISIEVLNADHRVSDRVERRIGLRSISMDRWVTSVNGERLFLKGSTVAAPRWIDDPTPLCDQVVLAREIGLDLLRVHAHISHPALYDTADTLGMLLWQDLPLYRGMHRGVRGQAVRQARQAVDVLGPHPSIALWCGHNEPTSAAFSAGAPDDQPSSGLGALKYFLDQQLPNSNRSLLDRSIGRALRSLDNSRPVIASSGVAPNLVHVDGSDSHLYLGWHYGDERQLPTLAQRVPGLVRFVGQFGAQSVPESIATTLALESSTPWPDLAWDEIAERWGAEIGALNRQVPPEWFSDIDAWAAATRHYQAHLVRYHIETMRRLKYQPTGGFCHFHLVDMTEQIGWSVIDHEGRPKPALEALRAACRPVLVMSERMDDHVHPGDDISLDLHVVSDLRVAIPDAEVTAHWSWDGNIQEQVFEGTVDADAATWVGTTTMIAPAENATLRLDLVLRYVDPRTESAVIVESWATTRVIGGHHQH